MVSGGQRHILAGQDAQIILDHREQLEPEGEDLPGSVQLRQGRPRPPRRPCPAGEQIGRLILGQIQPGFAGHQEFPRDGWFALGHHHRQTGIRQSFGRHQTGGATANNQRADLFGGRHALCPRSIVVRQNGLFPISLVRISSQPRAVCQNRSNPVEIFAIMSD